MAQENTKIDNNSLSELETLRSFPIANNLPTVEEILFAMSEMPLGEGEEAKVYKVHTKPMYTVRVSHNTPPLIELHQLLTENSLHYQPDIFSGRNFAQSLAWWGENPYILNTPLITVNYYAPGFSLEVHKAGREKPDPESALVRTRVLSETVAHMSEKAMDKLYDDLHFLNSRRHSIDVGAGGYFQNTGNMLYSANHDRVFPIDLQPFITTHPGIPADHTKGFNMPLYLTHGLLPGAHCYGKAHSNDPELISLRSEIIHNIIAGAERNNYNDLGGYLGNTPSKMPKFWKYNLQQLHIPEKLQEEFIGRICKVTHHSRYDVCRLPKEYMRVAGKTYD